MHTFGLHLLDFTPNAILTMAVFAHMCENYIGIYPNVALFRHFFIPRVEAGAPLAGGISWVFRLNKKDSYLSGELRGKWEEWRADWCWVVEDQPQPFTAPRATPITRGKDWSELDSGDRKLTVALIRILRLQVARLSVGEVGTDFLRRRIAPLQDRKRPAWEYGNAADIMRLRPGLNFNFTSLELKGMVRELFKHDPAHPEWFRGPRGVVPLCNSTARDSLRAMMPACDSHGVDRTWIPLEPIVVLNFFDNLTEVAKNKNEVRELTRDTTAQEIAYIASRVEEAAAAAAAGEFGFSPEEAEAPEASCQAEEAEIRRLLKLPPDEFAGVPSLRHSGIQGILTEAAARGNAAGGQEATAQDAGPSKPAGAEEEEEEEAGGDDDSDGSLELYADDLSLPPETSPPRASPRRSPLKRLRKTATGARAQAPRQQPARRAAQASRGSQTATGAPGAPATAEAARTQGTAEAPRKSAPSGRESSQSGATAPPAPWAPATTGAAKRPRESSPPAPRVDARQVEFDFSALSDDDDEDERE